MFYGLGTGVQRDKNIQKGMLVTSVPESVMLFMLFVFFACRFAFLLFGFVFVCRFVGFLFFPFFSFLCVGLL